MNKFKVDRFGHVKALDQFKFGHFNNLKLVKMTKEIGYLDASETTSLNWSFQ